MNENEITERINRVTDSIEELLRPIIRQVRDACPLLGDDDVCRTASRDHRVKWQLKKLKDRRRDLQAELNRVVQKQQRPTGQKARHDDAN